MSRAKVHTSVTSVTFSALPSITVPERSRAATVLDFFAQDGDAYRIADIAADRNGAAADALDQAQGTSRCVLVGNNDLRSLLGQPDRRCLTDP